MPGVGATRVASGGREPWATSTVLTRVPDAVDGRAIVEAQQLLADKERFISSVLAAIGAMVLVLDDQGRILRFNGACERLSGYSQDEVVGLRVWELLVPPDEIAGVKAATTDLPAGIYPNSHENHWLVRGGGSRLIAWVNTCLTDGHGNVTHVIATGVDVTEARSQHDALHGIETIGRVLSEQGPVPAAIDAVLSEMQTWMGFRFLALYMSDSLGLRLVAQRGYLAASQHVDARTGVVGRVYRTGRAELLPDVKSDRDYVPEDECVASEIAVPLLSGGATLGVLNVEAEPPAVLMESDLQFVRTVADRLASALRRSQVEEALRDRVRLFSALAEFTVAVNAIREPRHLAAALVDAVTAVLPSDTVLITLLDRSDGKYRVSAVRGFAPGVIGAIIEPGEGTAGRAIKERAMVSSEPHSRASTSKALRDYVQYEMVRTVGVPLISEGTVLGAISVARAETGAPFTDAEREVLGLLGSHAALAQANANLMEDVSGLAIRDGLTGLYNRRHFDAALDLSVARFKRHATEGSLAAIMFDLDHFGEFNNVHGHLAGDALLREFGEILRNRLRSADIVARYGGEEFVAILEDCGLDEAARLADEVRRELESRSVKGPDGRKLHATVCAGCAVLYRSEPTKEALLGRADIGLYMAKEAGRNRVVAV